MTIPTPLFDSWRTDAQRRLAPRGRKADLARFLTSHYGKEQRSWERYIAAMLSGAWLPNAEVVLAITSWFSRQEAADGSILPPPTVPTKPRS